MPVLIIGFSISIGGVILAISALSFLGYGLPPGSPDWGSLLSREGRASIWNRRHGWPSFPASPLP